MLRALQAIGGALRESARGLEAVSGVLANSLNHAEPLSRHRNIMNLYNKAPRLRDSNFIAPSASVQGEVSLGNNASVWYGAIIRGQASTVTVGENTSVQDGSVLINSDGNNTTPTIIGNNVTIAQGCVVDQCNIGSDVLIGAGSTLNKGVSIQSFSIIAAGSSLPADTVVPSGELWAGVPAKKVRDISQQEKEMIASVAATISGRAAQHAAVANREWSEIARTVPARIIDSSRDLEREQKLALVPDSQRVAKW